MSGDFRANLDTNHIPKYIYEIVLSCIVNSIRKGLPTIKKYYYYHTTSQDS